MLLEEKIDKLAQEITLLKDHSIKEKRNKKKDEIEEIPKITLADWEENNFEGKEGWILRFSNEHKRDPENDQEIVDYVNKIIAERNKQ